MLSVIPKRAPRTSLPMSFLPSSSLFPKAFCKSAISYGFYLSRRSLLLLLIPGTFLIALIGRKRGTLSFAHTFCRLAVADLRSCTFPAQKQKGKEDTGLLAVLF